MGVSAHVTNCHVTAASGTRGTAEEVGFEPTVPQRGTPVFETGPFNHSGTPPENLDRWADRATFLEEPREDRATFFTQEPRRDLGAVIEPGIRDEPVQAVAGPGLGIGRSIDDAGDSSLDDRSRAHRAGLQGHI